MASLIGPLVFLAVYAFICWWAFTLEKRTRPPRD